ncbi:EscU/YscU/HrcU family type III secretion system export apparatus switch protein [Alicyclobacillus tolerans]|uniref:Flagellar biosynthesis protein n=2 Tax=Alicyclobacillus tolerans TaxID=90970 RepID=A0ABT9LZS2_9BACL|nr:MULTISPECIES: EscU/YscU/HrcU family type III secretion system export apparatus switch protein [Alicyclobacillus]MDP9729789.1 flagellar biosynthesis protein [Alicyclobacillus tengchongensis]QRF23735.1 flagellar biosynthesis protein FlhB [Alicyclobacillus sp. TC]SHK35652.1 flagellar biosynthesis protein [Alicyclobacillus montanus]
MKVKKAVALRYRQQVDAAPRVLAKGVEQVAQAIIDSAHQNHVPIWEDEKLVHSLLKLEIDDVIPEELYEPVAHILAYLFANERES